MVAEDIRSIARVPLRKLSGNFSGKRLKPSKKKAIASALKRIVARLQRSPLAFGEPYYRLPALRLQIRTCIVSPLVVHYAVSEDQPLVFIKAVRLLREGT